VKILIETIPHSEQRYPTVGDWQWKTVGDSFGTGSSDINVLEPVLCIRVSRLSDWRYEALVGLHEAVEALLCKQAGVTEHDVDTFDLAFEANRLPDHLDEPGNHPEAPYHDQHLYATAIETALACWLKVGWEKYESEIDSL
jgi:hypothetical protein